MIQRVQTIWLLLAGIAAVLTLQFPYYSGIQDPTLPYQELTALTGGPAILALTILITVIAFLAVALFKNRIIQRRLCVLGILLEAILIFLYYNKVNTFTAGNLALASILHMCIVLFFVLAARGITKDENLIRNSDRLR